MDKIPVGQTIARAYGFAFRDFFKILSVMWLPLLVLSVFTFSLQSQFAVLTGAMQVKDVDALGPSAWIVLLPAFVIVSMLFFMQIVGITQQALGLRKGSPYYYFSLKQPLWNLIKSYLLVLLMMIACAVLFAIGSAVVAGISTTLNNATAGGNGTTSALIIIMTVIFSLFAYGAFIYVFIRQTFLLPAVVVAEEEVGFGRAWSLGKGNFWRMFTIFLSIFVPLVAVEMAVFFGIVLRGMPPDALQGGTPEKVAAWDAAFIEHMTGEWYIILPPILIISVIFYGLVLGAQSFAYRSLVPAEKVEDVF